MNLNRRRTVLFAVGGSTLLTAGCMTKPLRPANADGTYCFRIGKSYRPTLTCTPAPIPSEQVEADAKRFEPTPGKLTVYLVRKRWGDAKNVVRVSSDGAAPSTPCRNPSRAGGFPRAAAALPSAWPEGSANLDIAGAAGEVVFVEVIGSVSDLGQQLSPRTRRRGGVPPACRCRCGSWPMSDEEPRRSGCRQTPPRRSIELRSRTSACARQLLDTGLAQTIAWIWLGFLVAGVVAWLAYRYWRRRHPPPPAGAGTELQPAPEERLAKRQGAAASASGATGPTRAIQRRH